jgi:hypothetical protein
MIARALLLLPAFLVAVLAAAPTASADEPTRRELQTSSNNLKQIALSFHNFHDSYGFLPTDIVDKSGKPLLSWRVAILPFIEQVDLYKSFKMDEPWDGPNNKKLIEKMPKIYAPVRVQGKAGETYYQVFYGDKAPFGPKVKKLKITDITDGTSNTGMVFEAGEPVIWSKPADLPFDVNKPLPKLGGLFDGDFHVALFDGSVMLMKKNPDEKLLKNFIMPADENPIDISKLRK